MFIIDIPRQIAEIKFPSK